MHRIMTKGTALVLCTLVAIGCGGPKKKSDGPDAGTSKQVITDKGSDTMVLLAQAWAEAFGKTNPTIQIQVTGGGSGTGIAALMGGTTDIANSSRPMTDEEKAQFKAKYNADVIEIPVARDGVAIYVHLGNKLDSITIEQLRDIFSGKVTDWKDVGGTAGHIVLYGRENSSGTYQFFKEHVLNKGDFAANTQTLPGTAAIVNAVTKDAGGIGYGGDAYSKGVKVLKVVGKDGTAVAVNEETVRAGTYPLSRTLYFYLRQQPFGAIKTYIDWVTGPEGQQIVSGKGYFPLK